jgi:hypothetical protein
MPHNEEKTIREFVETSKRWAKMNEEQKMETKMAENIRLLSSLDREAAKATCSEMFIAPDRFVDEQTVWDLLYAFLTKALALRVCRKGDGRELSTVKVKDLEDEQRLGLSLAVRNV